MDHSKTPDYLRAIKAAQKEIEDGHALSYLTAYHRETGRYIELLTDQGWNPEPFWSEYRDEPYTGANDTTPD